MTNNSVIVTGGNGYIGSHMCKLLANHNFDVHIIDNHATSPEIPTHSYGTFHNIDIADEGLQNIFKSIRPVCVFHFAARALVSEGQSNPLMYYKENVIKTINLLDSCIKSQISKFVFSSTCATFGVSKKERIDEFHPQNPINTYGKTKLIIENVLRDLAEKNLLDSVALRYFNAVGCSPDGEIGENHDPETHLIPNICKSVLSDTELEFYLYGTDYETRDGTCIRDYIHVNDLAQAHLDGFHFIQQNSGFYDFNLGSENGHSVKEVLNEFSKVTSTDVKIKIKDRRPGDPPTLVANSSKAKSTLGFTCKNTLSDSILHTYNYLKSK